MYIPFASTIRSWALENLLPLACKHFFLLASSICFGICFWARENLLPLARKYFFLLVLDHLLPILKEGFNMIRGIPNDEIAQMKHELETIEEFIHQADKMAPDAEGANTTDGTRKKIKQLIEASFRIQDVIDDYIICKEQQLPDPRRAARAFEYVKTKKLRLQIDHDIHNIRSQISEMKETCFEMDHEGSTSSATTSLQNLQDEPFYLDEADVVGFEKPRDELVNLLEKGRDKLTVVSVVAMGGQGKTTLAKKVFDSKEVTGQFGFRVWITVSQSYDIEELLRDMLKELCKQQKDDPPQKIHEMNKASLVKEVRNYLQEKRYIVVFDDVWKSSFWADIKFAMIDNKNGSRILITTRTMDVATSFTESCFVEIHELKGLDDEQSLKLFYKKAFHDLDGCCPENLVSISSKIVKKCAGLPLAVVVTGGLLFKNRSYTDWYKFSENMNIDSKINKLLALSYHDLPYNIKSCLLYFGLYPEDCIVPSKMLTLQWIAEGFVKEDRGRTLEEVAEGYLTMLIHRSLVQVVSISIDGRAKSCRVHDLVHAMILEKCEDLSFCKIISEDKQSSLTGMARRLSIADSSDNLLEGIENSQVRSLIVYKPKKSSESSERRIPTKYRRLKVLNIDNDGWIEYNQNLQCLSHLKYFRIRYETSLPLQKSIGMMGNLETLDFVKDPRIYTAMPKEICMLRKLRHFIGGEMNLIPLKDGIGGMTSLQTLPKVHLDSSRTGGDNRVVDVKLIQELGKLKQLRRLVLLNVRAEYSSAISSSVNEMQQLEKLDIKADRHTEFIDLDLNSPPPMLSIVNLDSLMSKKFPEWISKLQNLTKLRLKLYDSKQMDDAMKLLKSMPSLLSLRISYDYYVRNGVVDRLHFQHGSFKNLKVLRLRVFLDLMYIRIDEGALGSLKELELSYIPKLKSLPTGIQHLSKLEVLSYASPSEEFEESIALEEGKEHSIFKHVLVKNKTMTGYFSDSE